MTFHTLPENFENIEYLRIYREFDKTTTKFHLLEGKRWWFHRHRSRCSFYNINKCKTNIIDWDRHFTQKVKRNMNKWTSALVLLYVCRLQASRCGSHLENERRGFLRCGSRWGRNPETGEVWEQTLSWVCRKYLSPCSAEQQRDFWDLRCSENLQHPAERPGSERERWPFVDLAGELREDLGGAAVVAQLGLDQSSQLAHLLDLREKNTTTHQSSTLDQNRVTWDYKLLIFTLFRTSVIGGNHWLSIRPRTGIVTRLC